MHIAAFHQCAARESLIEKLPLSLNENVKIRWGFFGVCLLYIYVENTSYMHKISIRK